MMPLLVISDLHLSHGTPGKSSALVAGLVRAHPGHELILAGDAFNLSVDPPSRQASESVSTLLAGHSELRAALRNHLARGDRLTLIAGNHDAGILSPDLHDQLLARLELTSNTALELAAWFVRRDGIHIEHGHFYDPDNAPAHPLACWSWQTEPLGVALTRRFLSPNAAFEFAHAYETTPAAGIAKAFRVFGPRAPQLIARYFALAAKLCAETREVGRFDAERAAGNAALDAFAKASDLDAAMVRSLLATGPTPTHESFERTFMRLYFDRVVACVGLVTGGTARALTPSPLAGALAAASALYLIASVKGYGNRYQDLPVERLRRAAAQVRELTAAKNVIFGHTHQEDEDSGYMNLGSFGYAPKGRPYVLVHENGCLERRHVGSPG